MNFDWTLASSMAQVAGTILVAVSLYFAGRQNRMSRESNQLTALIHIRETMNGFSDLIAGSKELTELVIKGRQSYLDLSADEKLRFERIYARLFNHLESWHMLIENKGFDVKIKDTKLSTPGKVIQTFFGYIGVIEFWETYKSHYIPSFVNFVEKSLRI